MHDVARLLMLAYPVYGKDVLSVPFVRVFSLSMPLALRRFLRKFSDRTVSRPLLPA